MIVSRYLATHDWKGQIKTYQEAYRIRRDAMLEALAHYLPPGCRWTHPAGGFYVWLTVPEGLDTMLASGSGGLSAGEAQLLAFTRVFLRDPGLVILDEASSRLDPATEQLIENTAQHINSSDCSSNGTFPNNLYGYGFVNAARAAKP